MARVGLGCLGVVAELTLQCVPSHQLLQHTQVMTRQQVHDQHKQLLQQNRHLRYMWLPYTDAVVVVTGNAYKEVGICSTSSLSSPELSKWAVELSHMCKHQQHHSAQQEYVVQGHACICVPPAL